MECRNIKKDLKYRIGYQQRNLLTHFAKYVSRCTPWINNYTKKVIWTQDSCKSRIKNICLTSGLECSSNVSSFKVSRHFFRRKSSKCVFPGVRKASW